MRRLLENTGRSRNPGHFRYTFFNLKNYLVFAAALGAVSAVKWIANLGVVPLFLFSAFLLAPAFFAFLNLLFVVTHVLETIGKLLYNRDHCHRIHTNNFFCNNLLNFKPYFLPILNPCVKGFFTFLIMIPALSIAQGMAFDVILSKGQSQSLKLSEMEKFNVGNKEVLTYKFNEKDKTLLIRGAKLGTSELLVWNKGGLPPVEYQIFVISKIQESKFLQLAQLLGSLGLETKVQPPHLVVSGRIQGLKEYLKYKKIQKQNDGIILDEAELSTSLKKDILADVYLLFFNDYKDSINCKVIHSNITCFTPNNEAPGEAIKKHLVDQYQITLVEHNNQKFKNNYAFKLKIIQLEQMDGEELRLGLEQLSTTLGELISVPIKKIVEKNAVLLAQKKVQMNTLAEPGGLIRPMSPAEFQIGADVPYVSASKDGTTNTTWQFAGLRVRVKLENMGEKVKIVYETELTKPSGEANGSINGNKEKSSVVIDLNQSTQLFQISLRTQAEGVDQMPFLNRIPLLGELFKSKSSQNNYKMITGIIEVKNYE